MASPVRAQSQGETPAKSTAKTNEGAPKSDDDPPTKAQPADKDEEADSAADEKGAFEMLDGFFGGPTQPEVESTPAKSTDKALDGFFGEATEPKVDPTPAKVTQAPEAESLSEPENNPFSGAPGTADPFGPAAGPFGSAGGGSSVSPVDSRIDPIDGYDAGRQRALLEQRPLLVILGAQWCGWCRQLEGELEQSEADAILKSWVVAKVDVDQEREIAGRFQALSLPALRILDGAGEVIASRTGYVSQSELDAWLQEHLDRAHPMLQSVLFETRAPNGKQTEQLVALLSKRTASIRTAAAQRLMDHPSVAAGPVVDELRSGSLSAKLASLEILAAWNAPIDGIDPWNPGTINGETTAPLVEWLRDSDRLAQNEVADQRLNHDPRQVSALLSELINAPELRRRELIERAALLGESVATESKRLEASLESLSDEQRLRLRQVRYRALAGPATRLAAAGLLETLSSLDGPTHFEAAEKILDEVTSQDQPLIDELSNDRDPLVRELAVATLHRIGALTTEGRLQRLLADESPSVRTAVLRQLAEEPSKEITQRLIDYLKSESDEDLLIYATKTLGKLASDKKASDALADLIGDRRWRVRAAALDAVGEFADSSSSMYAFEGNESGVSEAIADAVLERTNDSDAFVAKKAQFLLPNVISKRTAEPVAQFFLADLERAREIIDTLSEYERDEQLSPLVELSTEWLDGDDPQQLADAALLMTEISPTTLRYRLDDLLQSDDAGVRLAALRAYVPCMDQFRERLLGEEIQRWRLTYASAEAKTVKGIELIHPVPESFNPVTPTEVETDSDEKAQPEKTDGGLSIVENEADTDDDPFSQLGGFFGSSEPRNPEATEDVDPSRAEPNVTAPETEEVADDQSEPFDIAASLFGETPKQRPNESKDKDEDTSNAPALSAERLGMPSYWMQRWQENDQSISRPTWIRGCQPILQDLAQSENPVERQWAKVALLCSGDRSVASDVLNVESNSSEDLPGAELFLSWLPEKDRLEWISQHLGDLVSSDAADDESMANRWREVSVVDSLQAVEIIDDFVLQQGTISDEPLERITMVYRRLLAGGLNEEGFESLSTEGLRLTESGNLATRSMVGIHPSQGNVTGWLIDRFQNAGSDEHRAMLLAVLANTSRRHALAEALAILDGDVDDGLLTRVSVALVLGDLPKLAVDRAIVLLDHPQSFVVDAALTRMTGDSPMDSPDQSSYAESIAVPRIYLSMEQPHPLQLAVRPLPIETLKQLSESENETSAAIASTLLLASGAQEDLDELLGRLGGVNQPLTLMTIALAKAKRTDDAALDIYRRCAQGVEWYDTAAVRKALVSLRDDQVKQIIKEYLQDYDSPYFW